MKLIRYLLFSAVLFISCSVRAQDTLMISRHAIDSIGYATYVLNGNNGNDTISLGIWLYNRSDSTFIDSVSFEYSVSNGGLYNIYNTNNYNGSGISFTARHINIAPHDSLLMHSVLFQFSSPVFVVGSSTVVIWPTVYNHPFVIIDSATAQVNLTAPLSIKNPENDAAKVYISGGNLYIKEVKNAFGELRIYNTVEELILSQKISGSTTIPMSSYASGIYMIEIKSAEGQRAVYKVLNDSQR